MDFTEKTTETYKPIIGLEVHLELTTKSKMFCSCSAEHFGKEPNTLTCPVCLGLPGALPYPNKKAIDLTILTGLALNCQIPLFSKFDRKNYFYPDLPKGYQISQYDKPLCINGKLSIQISPSRSPSGHLEGGGESGIKNIRIRRVHLEEDTGKLIHEGNSTLIDFNRSGVPLMEIVTEPDMNSAEEVVIFLQRLQLMVRYLKVSSADMEKGQMRCEPTVNLEIVRARDKQSLMLRNRVRVFTPLVELKNINSFRFVKKAIDFEIKRQIEQFEKTKREKEPAADYRYFPEPDIPPIRWTSQQIANFKLQIANLELPEAKIQRFIKEYGLSEYDANILTSSQHIADFYEECLKQILSPGRSHFVTPSRWPDGLLEGGEITPKLVANWIINKRVDPKKTTPEEFVKMIVKTTRTPEISLEELEMVIEKVILENPKAVADFKSGKDQAIMFLVGQVMAKAKGKAQAPQAKDQLIKKLTQR